MKGVNTLKHTFLKLASHALASEPLYSLILPPGILSYPLPDTSIAHSFHIKYHFNLAFPGEPV